MEADKAKNIEPDPSLLLKLEDLKEQVKFLEQYSNSTRAAYQDLINYAGVSANKVEKVVDIVLVAHRWDSSRSIAKFYLC